VGGLENKLPYGMEAEIMGPHHFYAAYVFDQDEAHQQDIQTLINQAQQLAYPLRYWWLSDAMDLQGSTDRLIVCVHHPSVSEDAGTDLYDVLKEKGVDWDELDSAIIEEYLSFGRRVKDLVDLCDSNGRRIFPDAEAEG
jgi:hypothetical protein